jgi:hypothetical protein
MRIRCIPAWASLVVVVACRDQPTVATLVQPECTLPTPTMSPSSATIHPGDTLRVRANYTPCPTGLTPAFQYRSSDSAVAIVDPVNGLIAARSPGTSTIIAIAVSDAALTAAMALQVTPR